MTPGHGDASSFASTNDTRIQLISYKFEFYPIEIFTTMSETRGTLEPDALFTWDDEQRDDKAYGPMLESDDPFRRRHERMKVSPPYVEMRFFNVGDFVYAVGGYRVRPFGLYDPAVENLPPGSH